MNIPKNYLNTKFINTLLPLTLLPVTLLASASCVAAIPEYAITEFGAMTTGKAVDNNNWDQVLLARPTNFETVGDIVSKTNEDNPFLYFTPKALNNLQQAVGINEYQQTLRIATPQQGITDKELVISNVDNVYDFNDASEVLLKYNNGNDVTSIYSQTSTTSIGHLGGFSSTGAAINNASQATGYSSTINGNNHAFLYSLQNQSIIDLGTLGGDQSYGTAINKQGVVVGHADVGDGRIHAFSYKNNVMTDLGQLYTPFKFFNSYALDINNNDTIVGYADSHCLRPNFSCIDLTEAIITDSSTNNFQNLNDLVIDDLGYHLEKAVSINDNGQIVVEAIFEATNTARTLLLTPIYNSVQASMKFRGTVNNWGLTDMNLVANNTWHTRIAFDAQTNSSFKFDANGDWSNNWGDNNNDNIGDSNGSNINVTANGIYDITFNDQNRHYALQKIGQRYEAEASQLVGAQVASDHTGFSHTGFVDYINNHNDSLSQVINVPDGGYYSVRIRYANGGTTDRQLALTVSSNCCGQNETITFSPTNNWDNWGHVVIKVALSQGNNTLTLSGNGVAAPNIDYIEVMKID